MTRIHLLQASLPFTHSLHLPTEPYPQEITGQVKSCQLTPTPLADGSVLVTGTYAVIVNYTSPGGEKKKIRKIQSLKERIPVDTFPDLLDIPQKLAPREKWELAVNIPEPRVAAEAVRLQGTLVTNRGISSFSLIPRAASVRIEGNIVLDGWLNKPAVQDAPPPPEKNLLPPNSCAGAHCGETIPEEKNLAGNPTPEGQGPENREKKQSLHRYNPEQSPPPFAYDSRGIRQVRNFLHKGGISMVDDVKPAALRYAADEPPAPASLEADTGAVGPAALRYAADTEESAASGPTGEEAQPIAPEAEAGDTTPTQSTASPKRKKPAPYYRIPSIKGPGKKKGSDIMANKKATLKVEDLLRAGRSHFEIPKSKQEALKKKTPRRRG